MSILIRSDDDAVLQQPPFILRWSRPLPQRPIRHYARKPNPFPIQAPPPWLESGPAGEPFDFGAAIARLTTHVVSRCAELQHVDVSRLLFGVTQARNSQAHGLQARITPLRFRNGSLTRHRYGRVWRVQRYFVDDREMLYLMTFCLPRFLDQDFDEKLITLFHELYHINPVFDGDLRRHLGRYDVHSHSQRGYDEHMAHMARAYLADGADPALHSFLRLDFGQLIERHGSVRGAVLPRPKMIPLPAQRRTS